MNSQPPTVVLSYGLGVDSTALLLRWLTDPASRDFDLDDLLVVTAMVGSEWDRTAELVTAHILPRLRGAGVRFAQVARRSASQSDGIVIFDDSRRPERLHIRGAYRLLDEMLAAGTVPQTGGARLCSVKSKGWPIDTYLAAATAGQAFRHAIGFEVAEPARASRDQRYDTAQRTGIYPLIQWGWDRQRCLEFIEQITGVAGWPRSSCGWCPFMLATSAGRRRALDGYQAQPSMGVEGLMMEHLAVCLNDRQGLIGGKRLVDLVRDEGREDLLAGFHQELASAEHALYEVRRILRPRREDPTRMANASRSLNVMHTGGRGDLDRALERVAARTGIPLDRHDGIARLWLRRRESVMPCAEHFLVVAPAGAHTKQHQRFEGWWSELTGRRTPALAA